MGRLHKHGSPARTWLVIRIALLSHRARTLAQSLIITINIRSLRTFPAYSLRFAAATRVFRLGDAAPNDPELLLVALDPSPFTRPPQPDPHDLRPVQVNHAIAHRVEHPANLPVPALAQGDLQRARADHVDLARQRARGEDPVHAVPLHGRGYHDAVSQHSNVLGSHDRVHDDEILFIALSPASQRRVGQPTIRGEKDQARAVLIEPSDGEQPRVRVVHRVDDVRPVARVRRARHPARLPVLHVLEPRAAGRRWR
eukprot:30415-Pelagococcus_subviridis.AAC.2